jgi:hypothetical protein
MVCFSWLVFILDASNASLHAAHWISQRDARWIDGGQIRRHWRVALPPAKAHVDLGRVEAGLLD